MPGVCGVFESSSPARTMRTPWFFQSGMLLSVVIRATHVIAALSTKQFALAALETCRADRTEQHGVFRTCFRRGPFRRPLAVCDHGGSLRVGVSTIGHGTSNIIRT